MNLAHLQCDIFYTCEYFEEKFNYDEVLELPPTQAGTGGGDGGGINIEDEFDSLKSQIVISRQISPDV